VSRDDARTRGGLRGEAERFVPDDTAAGSAQPAGGAQMRYEHLHRYALAAALGARRRFLDIGCGAGYGAQMLRRAGCEVLALDIDRECARGAAPGVQARAERLPLDDAAFERVICFETIEHVRAPEEIVAEIARVTAPDGLAFVSTPNRRLYSQRSGHHNPFHLRELDRDEFEAMLGRHFSHFRLLAQSPWAGSWIRDDGATDDATRLLRILRDASAPTTAPSAPWCTAGEDALPQPLYLFELCAHEERTLASLQAESVFHDPRQALLGELIASGLATADRNLELESARLHARQIEEELEQSRQRCARLEEHVANVEEREQEATARARALAAHARNVEADGERWRERAESLETHAHNLEERASAARRRARELETHAANTEQLTRAARERAASLEAHSANLEAEIATARARVEAIEEHSHNVETHRDGLSQHVVNLEARIEATDARRGELETHAAHLEERSRNLEAQATALKAESEAAHARLAALLAARWVRLGIRLRLLDPKG